MSKIPNFKMYSKLYGCICNMLSDVFFAFCMPQESSIQLIWFYFFLCVIYVIDVFDWYLANDMLKLIRVVIVKYAVGFWIYQIWYSPIKIIWDHSTSFNNDVRYNPFSFVITVWWFLIIWNKNIFEFFYLQKDFGNAFFCWTQDSKVDFSFFHKKFASNQISVYC